MRRTRPAYSAVRHDQVRSALRVGRVSHVMAIVLMRACLQLMGESRKDWPSRSSSARRVRALLFTPPLLVVWHEP